MFVPGAPARLASRAHGVYFPGETIVEQNEEQFKPKPLSLRQNIILTVKVLAGAGAMIALLWLGSVYTAR